ncbi:MAG TPA: hypothetical protein VMT00_06985 [Thermoanaerobaculia bacterium]|nr:hypothetical protein [Thermoanaerobaculia bacterium]
MRAPHHGDSSQRRHWRPALATAALLAIIAGGFEPFYLEIFRIDRVSMHTRFVELPYRKLPGFRAFLVEARSITRAEERIALLVPGMRWDEGYEYAYARSMYLLAGRRVVPLVGPDDRFRPEALRDADVIVSYRGGIPFPEFETIWSGEHGVVARRVP